MQEWGIVAAAAGIWIIAAASITIGFLIRNMLLRAEAVLRTMEEQYAALSEQTSQVMEQASRSLGHVERQLAAAESMVVQVKGAVHSASEAVIGVSRVSQKAAQSAAQHLEQARLDNEKQLGELFRWLDIGVSFWHAWHRRSPRTGGGQAE
ncbi:DUF948 domain-containing protein [Paenibacillus sp. JSM ZJ436]